MKKILFMLFAAAAFVACDDDVTREPSPVTAEDCQNVYFPNSNEASALFEPTVTEFAVTVAREVTDEAAEVPVKVECVTPECFVFPETVVFEAGAATAEYVIGLTEEMAYFTPYQIALTIADEYADHYTVNPNGAPIFAITVQKSDWKVVANGGMCSPGWFGNTWYEQTIEYSAYLDEYRFPNYFEADSHVNFTWDGGATIVMKSTLSVTFQSVKMPAYYAGPMSGTSIYMCAYPEGQYQENVFLFQTLGYANGYGMQTGWGVFSNYVQVTEWLE